MLNLRVNFFKMGSASLIVLILAAIAFFGLRYCTVTHICKKAQKMLQKASHTSAAFLQKALPGTSLM